MCAHGAALHDSVAALERVERFVAQEPRSKELCLGVDIQGGLCYRGTSQEPAVFEVRCDLHERLGPLGLVVLNGCAFVYGDHAMRTEDLGHPFACGLSFL